MNKMGKSCSKAQNEEGTISVPPHKKQNKNIDDRKMLKVGIDIMNKEFRADRVQPKGSKNIHGQRTTTTKFLRKFFLGIYINIFISSL